MRPFPKARIDALTDGIFGFAMTLLVVDLRLPTDLHLTTSAALWEVLKGLKPQAIAYVISFFVLAALWRNVITVRNIEDGVTSRALGLWIWYLLFVTMVPFSSALVGRYGDLPPAIWVYAANMVALGGLSLPLHRLEVPDEDKPHHRRIQRGTFVFIASALLSVAISLVDPDYAMWAYLLNLLRRLPSSR